LSASNIWLRSSALTLQQGADERTLPTLHTTAAQDKELRAQA